VSCTKSRLCFIWTVYKLLLNYLLISTYIKHGESFLEDFREYLKNLNQIKLVTLSICVCSSSEIHKIVSSTASNPVLLDISHLKLETFTREKESHALVDGLFCICRPESLLLVSGCARNDEFIKNLCEKLLQIENAATYANCGQHHLKGVKIQHCGRKGYTRSVHVKLS